MKNYSIFGMIAMIFVYKPNEFMFWIFLAGTLFFAFTVYCWIDEERYGKYEFYGTPVVFGLFFLLLVACTIIGLVYYIKGFIAGNYEWKDIPIMAIGIGSFGMFAYFTFSFCLLPYFKKKTDKSGKDNSNHEK